MSNVEKIKEEIESQLSLLERNNSFNEGRWTELNHLLLFISNLDDEQDCDKTVYLEKSKPKNNEEDVDYTVLCCRCEDFNHCSMSEYVREHCHIFENLKEDLKKEVDVDEEAERCWNEIFPLGWGEHSYLTLTHDEHLAFARHYAKCVKK